jgi:hypothetical protein
MSNKIKIMVLAFLFLFACVSVVSAGTHIYLPGDPSGIGVQPLLIKYADSQDNNPKTCEEMECCEGAACDGMELSDDIEPASYSNPIAIDGGHIKFTQNATNSLLVDWVSDVDINCIFIKAGNGGDTYCYAPGIHADTGLHGPVGSKNDDCDEPDGNPKEISHINVCYKPGIPVPEFPVGIIPAFIIGILGLVFFIREYH